MSHALGGSVRLRKPCEHGVYDKHPLSISEEWGNDYSVNQTFRCPGGEFLPEDAVHEITLEAGHEIHNNKGESMGVGCYPKGAVVGGDGECLMFALPPGRYLLLAADQVGEPG